MWWCVIVYFGAHKITSDCWSGISCLAVKLQHSLLHSGELNHVNAHPTFSYAMGHVEGSTSVYRDALRVVQCSHLLREEIFLN